jgi:hypothetical protein
VAQGNRLGAALEDAADENTALRRAAGIAPGAPVDASGVRVARDVALAQLRSVNALLERQVRAGWGAMPCPGCRLAFRLVPDCTKPLPARPPNSVPSLTCRPLPPPTKVSDLEEERRKLRLELKFRAKYHGRWVHANLEGGWGALRAKGLPLPQGWPPPASTSLATAAAAVAPPPSAQRGP